jgi:hypothetical protein
VSIDLMINREFEVEFVDLIGDVCDLIETEIQMCEI